MCTHLVQYAAPHPREETDKHGIYHDIMLIRLIHAYQPSLLATGYTILARLFL